MTDKKTKLQTQNLDSPTTDEKKAFTKLKHRERKGRRQYFFKFLTIISAALALIVGVLIMGNKSLNSQVRELNQIVGRLETENYNQNSKLQVQNQDLSQLEKSFHQYVAKSMNDQGSLEEKLNIKSSENQKLQNDIKKVGQENLKLLSLFENQLTQNEQLQNQKKLIQEKHCNLIRRFCDSVWWRCDKEDRIYFYQHCFDMIDV